MCHRVDRSMRHCQTVLQGSCAVLPTAMFCILANTGISNLFDFTHSSRCEIVTSVVFVL